MKSALKNVAPFQTDGYKINHWPKMYPSNMIKLYSNFTCRSFKKSQIPTKFAMVAGTQRLVKKLHKLFNKKFFKLKRKDVELSIEKVFGKYQGSPYDASHFMELYDLGYLPLRIKALPEGTLVPENVPMLTITNTHRDFAWLVNYLETYISNQLWMVVNSATIAYKFKELLLEWADKTDSSNMGFVNFQAHDFSMRGMAGNGTVLSGIGYNFSFTGSDNIPTIFDCMKHYYADDVVIQGVPATEHSVMSVGGKEGEIETFERLLDNFPDTILSVVSDTWNLWQVVTVYLPKLRDKILARKGKLVIRPDSGIPEDIVCGLWTSPGTWTFEKDGKYFTGKDEPIEISKAEYYGLIYMLAEIFGYTLNEQGYKVLHPSIGAIYGDSITYERAKAIFERLEAKGFASTNIVLGVGSYTLQHNTRDSLGMACKATYAELLNSDGTIEKRNIFKDPITDNGTKKSAKGLLKVERLNGAHGKSDYILYQEVSEEEERQGDLQVIYEDGEFYNETNLYEIRARIDEDLMNKLNIKKSEKRDRKTLVN